MQLFCKDCNDHKIIKQCESLGAYCKLQTGMASKLFQINPSIYSFLLLTARWSSANICVIRIYHFHFKWRQYQLAITWCMILKGLKSQRGLWQHLSHTYIYIYTQTFINFKSHICRKYLTNDHINIFKGGTFLFIFGLFNKYVQIIPLQYFLDCNNFHQSSVIACVHIRYHTNPLPHKKIVFSVKMAPVLIEGC